MKAVESIPSLEDVRGEPGTNAGGMLEKVRQVMANLTSQHPRDIKIQDLLAVDTFTPQKVQGGLANEFSQENAVGIAAMVKADRLQMEAIAREFAQQIGVPVEVGGVEADMAIRGALTTLAPTSPWPFWTWAPVRRTPPSSTPRDRSTPSTWPERATWSHS